MLLHSDQLYEAVSPSCDGASAKMETLRTIAKLYG